MKTAAIGDLGQKIGGAKKDRYTRSSVGTGATVPRQPRVKRKMQFHVLVWRSTGKYFLAKKGDREHRELVVFANREEAMTYCERFSQEQLEARWAEVREATNVTEESVRRDTNRPRSERDYRDGGNIAPEVFLAELQPFGVEFGNWQNRRKSCLNEAYDALRDLAVVLGWSVPALMFDRKLALAFGARGSGKAAAHYEPSHRVINLTKTAGAGCLAHEWFHAFDHHTTVSRNAEVADDSECPDFTGTNELHELLHSIPNGMKKRSIMADRTRSGGQYWSTPHEISARAFEAWVASIVDNDYLANILPAAEFTKGESRYPYPTEFELPAVDAAFRRLFKL